MKKLSLPVIIAILFSATAGHAQEITFTFTGVINRVDLAGPFAEGQTVTGSYTFDPTALDQNPSDEVGQYQNVIHFELSVPAAGYQAIASPASSRGVTEILNDQDGVRDRYVVSMTVPDQTISGGSVGDYTPDYVAIVLRDQTTLAFSTDALPLAPPALEDFAFGREAFLSFVGPLGNRIVAAELTSLTVSSVTELLTDLVQQVIGLNARSGVSNSLDAKLDAVMTALDDANDNNDVAAQNAMQAFINSVEAQRGHGLSDTQADQLVAAAEAIIAALGG